MSPASRVLVAPPIAVVVVVAGLVLLGPWLQTLDRQGGSLSGFVVFGEDFRSSIDPPQGARVVGGPGYDGQYFWKMAVDPWLGDATVDALEAADDEYRAQRILYPTLAWALAAGSDDLVPAVLQLVDWLAVAALVALFAVVAKRHGRSPWWGVALGLTPGMYLGLVRDLSDPLAVALLVAAVVALVEFERPGLAAAAGAAAVLTRESMLLLAIAVVVVLVARRLPLPPSLRPAALPRGAWIVPAVIAVVFGAWQLYARTRVGTLPMFATAEGQFRAPFAFIAEQLDQTRHDAGSGGRFARLAYANAAYLTQLTIAAVLAMWALVKRPDLPAVCATGFALVGITQNYGDHYSYTRATAPLLALLALIALQRSAAVPLMVAGFGVLLLPLYLA